MKKFLIVLMSLMLVCGCVFAEDAVTSATLKIDKLPEVEAEENGILVVYFSPDDTTKAAAYAIAALPEDLSQYDTIWLGYPIWGGQAPKIMYTFLENVDLAGKTIIPFCTSNSSGIGSSATNLQKVTGEDVKWEKGGRVKKGDNAEAIAEWIKSIIQN